MEPTKSIIYDLRHLKRLVDKHEELRVLPGPEDSFSLSLEYYLIETILKNPNSGPGRYYREVKESLGLAELDLDVLDILRQYNLHTPDLRKRWGGQAWNASGNLQVMMEEGRKNYFSALRRVKKVLSDNDSSALVIKEKAILVALKRILTRKIGDVVNPAAWEKFNHLLLTMQADQAKEFLYELIDSLAEQRDLGQGRDYGRPQQHGDSRSRSKRQGVEGLNAARGPGDPRNRRNPGAQEAGGRGRPGEGNGVTRHTYGTKDFPGEVSGDLQGPRGHQGLRAGQGTPDLQAENDKLRAALDIVETDLRRLQGDIAAIRQGARQGAVEDFFREMNSPRYGCLLDQFVQAERYLARLKGKGYHVPEEMETFPQLVRMFLKYVENCGLETGPGVGNTRQVDLEQSESYHYSGSEFRGKEEVKEVQVVSGGWKYNGNVISRPVIKEI